MDPGFSLGFIPGFLHGFGCCWDTRFFTWFLLGKTLGIHLVFGGEWETLVFHVVVYQVLKGKKIPGKILGHAGC